MFVVSISSEPEETKPNDQTRFHLFPVNKWKKKPLYTTMSYVVENPIKTNNFSLENVLKKHIQLLMCKLLLFKKYVHTIFTLLYKTQ